MTKNKFSNKLDFVAIDDGDFGIEPVFPVEKMDYRDAIFDLEPTIVLSSWMPMHHDWTPVFRQQATVRQYILFGEPEICGSRDSWGEHEDWEAVPMKGIMRYQRGRSDNHFSMARKYNRREPLGRIFAQLFSGRKSRCYLFRRRKGYHPAN